MRCGARVLPVDQAFSLWFFTAQCREEEEDRRKQGSSIRPHWEQLYEKLHRVPPPVFLTHAPHADAHTQASMQSARCMLSTGCSASHRRRPSGRGRGRRHRRRCNRRRCSRRRRCCRPASARPCPQCRRRPCLPCLRQRPAVHPSCSLSAEQAAGDTRGSRRVSRMQEQAGREARCPNEAGGAATCGADSAATFSYLLTAASLSSCSHAREAVLLQHCDPNRHHRLMATPTGTL